MNVGDSTERETPRKPIRWGLIATITVVIVAVGAIIVVFNPFTTRFRATLIQSGSGDSLTWWTNGEPTNVPYVNITLTFTSPSTLDPSNLNLTVSKPGEKIAFGSASGSLVDSVHLSYCDCQIPHWIATFGGSYWSGFTGTIINPDGSIVGGGNLSQAVQVDKIQSGAILTLTYPSYINSIQGYVLTAIYEGASGNATLTLEA